MSLKLSMTKLQDKYGLSLVQESLEQVLEEIREGSACQEHGIFQTFSLFIFTTFALFHLPHTLFTQFPTSRKDNTRAIDPMT